MNREADSQNISKRNADTVSDSFRCAIYGIILVIRCSSERICSCEGFGTGSGILEDRIDSDWQPWRYRDGRLPIEARAASITGSAEGMKVQWILPSGGPLRELKGFWNQSQIRLAKKRLWRNTLWRFLFTSDGMVMVSVKVSVSNFEWIHWINQNYTFNLILLSFLTDSVPNGSKSF